MLTAQAMWPIAVGLFSVITYGLVEFERYPVDVQDSKKLTTHFRGVCRIDLKLLKEKLKYRIITCDWLDLEVLH